MSDPNLVDRYLSLTRRALTPATAFRDQVQARLQAPPAVLGALAAVPSRVGRGWFRLSHRVTVAAGSALLALGFLAGYGARPLVDQGLPAPPLPRFVAAPAEATESLEPEPVEPSPAGAAASLDVASSEAAAPEAALPGGGPTRAAKRSPAPARGRPQAQPDDAAPTLTSRRPRDELALLQRAERAVRAENSALALMLTGELDQLYPRSELLEERSAIELMAHCVAHATDARPRAERFLRAHPRSVYAERIVQLCLGEPTPAADEHG
jgi:hypothetical protein